MSREIVSTKAAPQAIGTYSQAVVVNGVAYVSGQIPLDPATGELVEGDIRAQIVRVFDNLSAVAEGAGMTLADTAKLNVYLTDLGNFSVVNEVMATYFSQPYPARAALGISALPKGSQVEMDAILAR
ncbi:MAG: reactive intermediate/imine deaminase [Gammaproteobacteria bacterium]|jgi:reactive intermediate/imine deaminase